jgi:hypothetical protein
VAKGLANVVLASGVVLTFAPVLWLAVTTHATYSRVTGGPFTWKEGAALFGPAMIILGAHLQGWSATRPPAWVDRLAVAWKAGAKVAGMEARPVDGDGFVTLDTRSGVVYHYAADGCYSGFGSGQRTPGTLNVTVDAANGRVRVGVAEYPNTADRPLDSACPAAPGTRGHGEGRPLAGRVGLRRPQLQSARGRTMGLQHGPFRARPRIGRHRVVYRRAVTTS